MLLRVAHSTISRWIHKPDREEYHRTAVKMNAVAAMIKALVTANPLATSAQLQRTIKETSGLSVSSSLVRVAISRQGFSRKKARFYGQPPDLFLKTQEFVRNRNMLASQGRPFVSLDETSFGRHCATVYGYAPKGHPLRIVKKSPRTTTTSVLAMASPGGILRTATKQGSFNTATFLDFLRALDLPSGHVILLDNVSFHRSSSVASLAVERGWTLLFTPPYSPWFNPIEGIFSVVKRHFYKHQDRDAAFRSVEPRHAEAFFRHALGHPPCEGPVSA